MKRILIYLVFAAYAMAQSVPPGGGRVAAIIGPRGSTLPSTCSDGQLFQKTSGGSEGTYSCVLGAWVAAGSAGSVGSAGTGISIVGSVIAIDSTTTPQKNASGTWTAKQVFELVGITPSTAPGTPTSGQLYVDSTANVLSSYNGTIWKFYGTNPGTTKGDLFVCTDTATPCTLARIAAGTDGYYFGANGAGELPTYKIPTAAQITNAFDKTGDFANISGTNTGTSTTTAVTPDGLAGSVFGEKNVELVVTDFTTDTATGDGQFYFVVPASLNGMNLVTVAAQVISAGTTGTTDIQLARCATAASGNACSGTVDDMLSTKITIDSGENSTASAATAAVIDTAKDDVATGQIIRVDVDAVSTTKAKGLIVYLTFRLP